MDPGRRVVRRMEAGAGEPAVVLEAGMNNGAASWRRVVPLLAPHARVAAYDRAGIGGSAPAPGAVTVDRQIGDLATIPGDVLYRHNSRAFQRLLGPGQATEEQLREHLYYRPCSVCKRPWGDPVCRCASR